MLVGKVAVGEACSLIRRQRALDSPATVPLTDCDKDGVGCGGPPKCMTVNSKLDSVVYFPAPILLQGGANDNGGMCFIMLFMNNAGYYRYLCWLHLSSPCPSVSGFGTGMWPSWSSTKLPSKLRQALPGFMMHAKDPFCLEPHIGWWTWVYLIESVGAIFSQKPALFGLGTGPRCRQALKLSMLW